MIQRISPRALRVVVLLAIATVAIPTVPAASAGSVTDPVITQVLPAATPAPPVIEALDDGAGGENGDGQATRLISAVADLGDGRALMYGGFAGEFGTGFDDAWIFDESGYTPVCGTDVAGATDPCPPGQREAPSLVGLGDGRVLLYGGVSGDSGAQDTWMFDGSGWIPICGVKVKGADGVCGPGVRFGAAATLLDGIVYMVGGLTESGTADGTVWTFKDGVWTPLPVNSKEGPSGRLAASLTTYKGQLLLVGGGQFGGDGSGNDGEGPPVPVKDTWVLDPVAGTWTPLCGTKIPGADTDCGLSDALLASAAELPADSGRVVVLGGLDFGGGATKLAVDKDGEGSGDHVISNGQVLLLEGGVWTKSAAGWQDVELGDGFVAVPGVNPVGLVMTSRGPTCDAIGQAFTVSEKEVQIVTVVIAADIDGDGANDGCSVQEVAELTTTVPTTTTAPVADAAGEQPVAAQPLSITG